MPHQPTLNTHFNIVRSLCLCLPSGLFPLGLLTKTLHVPLLSSICATCTAHHFMIWSPHWHLVKNTDHKVSVTQSSPLPCYFVPPRPKLEPVMNGRNSGINLGQHKVSKSHHPRSHIPS
jgi:hypothetical protein